MQSNGHGVCLHSCFKWFFNFNFISCVANCASSYSYSFCLLHIHIKWKLSNQVLFWKDGVERNAFVTWVLSTFSTPCFKYPRGPIKGRLGNGAHFDLNISPQGWNTAKPRHNRALSCLHLSISNRARNTPPHPTWWEDGKQ